MNSDFRDLFAKLNEFQIRYVVLDGYALGVYGYVRYTQDIDILIGVDQSEIENIGRVLPAFGIKMTPEGARQLAIPNSMVTFGHPPFKVDLLNQVPGLSIEAAWERRNMQDFHRVQVSVISLADLIDCKKASCRPKDLDDVAALRARNPEIGN